MKKYKIHLCNQNNLTYEHADSQRSDLSGGLYYSDEKEGYIHEEEINGREKEKTLIIPPPFEIEFASDEEIRKYFIESSDIYNDDELNEIKKYKPYKNKPNNIHHVPEYIATKIEYDIDENGKMITDVPCGLRKDFDKLVAKQLPPMNGNYNGNELKHIQGIWNRLCLLYHLWSYRQNDWEKAKISATKDQKYYVGIGYCSVIRNYDNKTQKMMEAIDFLSKPFDDKNHRIIYRILAKNDQERHILLPQRFAFDPFYVRQQYTLVTILDKRAASEVKRLENNRWAECFTDPLLQTEFYNIEKLSFPTMHELIQNLDSYISNDKRHKNKLIAYKTVVTNTENFNDFIFAEDIIDNYRLFGTNNFKHPPFYAERIPEKRTRHYTRFNMISKFTRNLITYNGQQLVGVDVNSMHPAILFAAYLNSAPHSSDKEAIKTCIESGNIKNSLINLFGLIDDTCIADFKVNNLSYLNASPYQSEHIFATVDELYKEKLPYFRQWLTNLKHKNGYKSISRICLEKESKVINRVLMEFNAQKGCIALGCHDCAYTTEEHKFELKESIERSLMLEGIYAGVKFE